MRGECRREGLTCGALQAGLSRLPCGSCRGRQFSGSVALAECHLSSGARKVQEEVAGQPVVPWRPVCPVCPVAPAENCSCRACDVVPQPHAALASRGGAHMQEGAPGGGQLTCGALEAGLSRLPCGSCRGSRQWLGHTLLRETSCRGCLNS